jgi:hypothetical protein
MSVIKLRGRREDSSASQTVFGELRLDITWTYVKYLLRGREQRRGMRLTLIGLIGGGRALPINRGSMRTFNSFCR